MKLWIFILTISIITGCCQYSDKDFEFSENHKALFGQYNEGDTIYFQSQSGDYDTITVSTLDSFQECGGFMGFPRRNQTIEIKHLPKNKWNGGTELYQNKPPKVLDQEIIVIEKIPGQGKNTYFIGFNYRDFQAGLDELPKKKKDNLLSDLDINEYWQLNTDLPLEHQNDSTIIEIIWTTKYGLTSYYFKNGEYYKIKSVR